MLSEKSPVILMYHGIVADHSFIPHEREIGAELYDVFSQNFESQMSWLKDRSYKVIIYSGDSERYAEKEIVITFDDGERNNFENAFPVLNRFKFLAYFFVTINRINKPGYMNWEQLMELRDAGMLIGSHGLSHEILTTLKQKHIERELIESKAILEMNLKIAVDTFSVPRGFYDQNILTLAKEAGYKKVFVSDKKDRDDFCLGRIAVKKNWDLKRFELALQGNVPLNESLTNSVKGFAKKILGGKGYDQLRNRLLK